jgi:mono/diheme cytochrome c family protein
LKSSRSKIFQVEENMRSARLFALAALCLLIGCKASEPGKVQSSVMTSVKQNVTIGGKDWKNPVAYSPDVLKEGQAHFGHHCQVCHGLDGQNTGVPFATKMSPPVADLTSPDVQGYSDGQLKWIIENGIEPSGMPGWKGILEDDEMWKIVHFMRHLPAKGSLGVPDVFKEEADEHEAVKQGGKVDESKPHTHTHKH